MSFKKVATYTALVFGVVGLVALTGFTSVLNESATQLYSSLTSADDQETMKAYMNFIAEYGRVQSSHSKHNEKYEVFKANYEKIRRHNERADVPFVMSKPFSRTNSARIPPPRSSEPLMPQRLPDRLPVVSPTFECPVYAPAEPTRSLLR